MIRLFNSDETKFNSNGDHVINPFKLIETKKKSLNGWFIEVECSIEHKDIIVKDMLCVIQTKSKLNPQAFRINTLKVTSRKITFTADHVMFDGERYFLDNVRPTNMSAIGALNYIDDRADNDSPFSYTSNVSSSNTAYFIRKNLLEAWSIMEERWQGIFDADNFEISFNIDSPIDKGATLNYGVDLQGVEVIEDWSGVVTKLYPTGYDGIMLPEKFLLSEIEYQQPYTKTVHFESEFEEEDKTPENLIPELRANARKYMLQNEVPRVSYTVKSDVQQNLDIGDLIVVRHPVLLLNTQVQEYTYDVISKKVKTLVFGNYSRDVKKKFGEVKDLINKTVQKMSVTEALVNHQTNLINSLNKNGFVYIDDNEILILDKLPKENALNVWRFGLGGIGFSSNGYEGPFDFAFTQDGKFNASFISSGSITTNHLASDFGSSLDLSSNKAITALVKDLGTLDNGQNLILGANGELGYKGWEFSQLGLYPPFAQPHVPMNESTPIFIVEKVHSLSKSALKFFTKGKALSPIAYIVPNEIYSLRLKRQLGMQSFRVSIIEFNASMIQLKKTSVEFDDANEYEEVSFEPISETMYARFEIETLDSNSLTLTEIMFNRGTPSVWKESSEEVRVYAETIVQVLDNKFKIDIEEVERSVDGINHDIHNAGLEINAKEGILAYGPKLKIMDQGKTKELLSVVTRNGQESIYIDISNGSVGNFSLIDGVMDFTTADYIRDYTKADAAYVKMILESTVTPTSEDLVIYDLNGDGTINVIDYSMINAEVNGIRKINRIVKSNIKIGTNHGNVEITTWYKKDNNYVVGERNVFSSSSTNSRNLIAKAMSTEAISLKGKLLTVDSNGFVKAIVDV